MGLRSATRATGAEEQPLDLHVERPREERDAFGARTRTPTALEHVHAAPPKAGEALELTLRKAGAQAR